MTEYRTHFDADVEFAKVLAAAPRIEHLTNLAAVPPTGAPIHCGATQGAGVRDVLGPHTARLP